MEKWNNELEFLGISVIQSLEEKQTHKKQAFIRRQNWINARHEKRTLVPAECSLCFFYFYFFFVRTIELNLKIESFINRKRSNFGTTWMSRKTPCANLPFCKRHRENTIQFDPHFGNVVCTIEWDQTTEITGRQWFSRSLPEFKQNVAHIIAQFQFFFSFFFSLECKLKISPTPSEPIANNNGDDSDFK